MICPIDHSKFLDADMGCPICCMHDFCFAAADSGLMCRKCEYLVADDPWVLGTDGLVDGETMNALIKFENGMMGIYQYPIFINDYIVAYCRWLTK